MHMGASLDRRDDRHAYIGYIFEDLNAFVVNLVPNAGIGDIAEGCEFDFGNELPACSRQLFSTLRSFFRDALGPAEYEFYVARATVQRRCLHLHESVIQ